MTKQREWTYYAFHSLMGAHPTKYYRYWLGVTYLLDEENRKWIKINLDFITRYLQTGEIGLDRTTKTAIEDAVGFPLPD